jgi:hypothetical protein
LLLIFEMLLQQQQQQQQLGTRWLKTAQQNKVSLSLSFLLL